MAKVKDVERFVREPVVAGCIVRGRGSGTAILAGGVVGSTLGSVGRTAAEMAVESGSGSSGPLPARAFGLGYVCATADELVLLEAKQALLGSKVTAELARAPRAAVQGCELGSGTLSAPLTIRLDGGAAWELEVPRADLKAARALADALA